MRHASIWLSTLASVGLALAACGDDDSGAGGAATTTSTTSTSSQGGAGGQGLPPAGEDWTRDILDTGLELDMAARTGRATIKLAAAESTSASFEIGDLEITSVRNAAGDLNHATTTPGQLDVGVPSDGTDPTIIVEYAFKVHENFDGWMETHGVTFLWPYFCGNLYPCKSDPSDGLTFTMSVTGLDPSLTAVYPTSIPADAPSYMPAIAVDQLTEIDLGTTPAGTQIKVWHLPGQEADAANGTAHLVDVFDFFETTYGAYTFGAVSGAVSVNWGGGDFGGMEHHPYWHVSNDSLYSEETNAHEAAHGWYGDGVRIACWEDFVLSEGTVTYMAAHALEAFGVDVWHDYECELQFVCDPANGANTIALPGTCNEIDLLNDPLWSGVPYYKGAFFYRAVAQAIGADVLDGALGDFYKANVGKAARMNDLLDFIKTKTDAAGAASVDTLADAWLRTLDCPVDPATLCL